MNERLDRADANLHRVLRKIHVAQEPCPPHEWQNCADESKLICGKCKEVIGRVQRIIPGGDKKPYGGFGA